VEGTATAPTPAGGHLLSICSRHCFTKGVTWKKQSLKKHQEANKASTRRPDSGLHRGPVRPLVEDAPVCLLQILLPKLGGATELQA
jgi:hypothetical protein